MNKYTVVAVGLLGGFFYPQLVRCIKRVDSYFFSEKRRNDLVEAKMKELDEKFFLLREDVEQRLKNVEKNALRKIVDKFRNTFLSSSQQEIMPEEMSDFTSSETDSDEPVLDSDEPVLEEVSREKLD